MLSESRSLDLMRITGCNDGDKEGGKCFKLYSEKMCPVQRALLSYMNIVVTGPTECIVASEEGGKKVKTCTGNLQTWILFFLLMNVRC